MKRCVPILASLGLLLISSWILVSALRSLYVGEKRHLEGDEALNNQAIRYQGASDKEEFITSIEFSDKLIDIGDVPIDTVIFQNYSIKNIGDGPLVVLDVLPDCNCTGYTLSKKKAYPQDSIIVKLEIDMKKKHLGNFMINTVLRLNTEIQMYRLRLIGNVVK